MAKKKKEEKKSLTNEQMVQMEMNNVKVDKLALELENMRLRAEL